jgi:hypothetical protein
MKRRRHYSRPTKRTTITLPLDLLAYLEGLAATEKWSMSAMVAFMIESYRERTREA